MALLPSDPQKQKQVLVGLIPLIAAFGYYQFVYTPRAAQIAEMEARVEQLQTQNTASQAVLATYGGDLPRRLGIYQEHVRQLEQLIPRREDVPELIDMITEQAQRIGVDLTTLTPSIEEPGEHYSVQSYQLQVQGDYHAIGEYLTMIGSLPRIVRPHGVTIEPVLEGVQTDPDGAPRLRASFRIQTFVMPVPGETPPPAPQVSAE